MKSINGFDFFDLHCDNNGQLAQPQELQQLKQQVSGNAVTDVVLICHGFRNDENDATGLYTAFLKTFRDNLARPEFAGLNQRRWAVGGIYWPSKAFDEGGSVGGGSTQSVGSDLAERAAIEAKLKDLRADAPPDKQANIDKALGLLDGIEQSTDAQDEFVSLVLSILDGSTPDPSEGLDNIRAKNGSDLLQVLKIPVILPTSHDDSDDGGAAAFTFAATAGEDDDDAGRTQGFGSVFGTILGGVGKFLNLTTWYLMKDRSGLVGANGIARVVREVKSLPQAPKVHLVGHSLGGRAMAACGKSLTGNPRVQPDSMTLLEAAFSHYGFSAKTGTTPEGFFRAVVQDGIVKGPLIATFSAMDAVVGNAYAISSRLAGDNSKAIGDRNDPFGGIGRNGAQKCTESIEQVLNQAGTAYRGFPTGKVVCLDGSAKLINSHGDVTNPHVTYAFASAVALT